MQDGNVFRYSTTEKDLRAPMPHQITEERKYFNLTGHQRRIYIDTDENGLYYLRYKVHNSWLPRQLSGKYTTEEALLKDIKRFKAKVKHKNRRKGNGSGFKYTRKRRGRPSGAKNKPKQ